MAKAPHIAAFLGRSINRESLKTIISDMNYNFGEAIQIQNPLMTLNASLEFCEGRTLLKLAHILYSTSEKRIRQHLRAWLKIAIIILRFH